jgi:hypothetical protein
MQQNVESVAAELLVGGMKVDTAKSKLAATRKEVERVWRAIGDILISEGQLELAGQIRRFADQMPPPQMERELIAGELIRQMPLPHERDHSLVR